MGLSRSPEDSGLIAILLITRPRPGPRLVFHHPPEPQTASRQTAPEAPEHDASDPDSDEDEDSPPARRPLNDARHSNVVLDEHVLGDINSRSRQVPTALDNILGYSIDSLEKLLSPGEWSDGKKFECCLDGITFIGYPVYVDADGESVPRTLIERPQPVQHQGGGSLDRAADHSDVSDSDGSMLDASLITITTPDTPARMPNDYTHITESMGSQTAVSLGTSVGSVPTTSGSAADQIAMFHVVFALAGTRQEYATEVYQQVVMPLSKALQYCHKQSGYVSRESRKMLAMTARAKQTSVEPEALGKELVENSELAWALKEMYEKLSTGDVAGIRLDGKEMSLHIARDGALAKGHATPVDGQSGLLLLEDKDSLLRELSHPEASPLAYFIRESTPTKPLRKLADRLNMPLDVVLYLAEHLVKWRKARAIVPLHPRNIYIVRADAPIDKVAELIPIYARRFAALPTLPQMLKVLSGKPIKYGLMIPSKDHRAPYMEILAFLYRHGFVTQLKTFGWLQATRLEDGDATSYQPRPSAKRERPISGISLLSPHLRPVEDDVSSVTSEQTVITTVPAGGDETQRRDSTASLTPILNPTDPSHEEEDALRQVMASVSGTDLQEILPHILDHFDGEHALEEIAVSVSMKRSRVEDLLDELQQAGHLITFRAV